MVSRLRAGVASRKRNVGHTRFIRASASTSSPPSFSQDSHPPPAQPFALPHQVTCSAAGAHRVPTHITVWPSDGSYVRICGRLSASAAARPCARQLAAAGPRRPQSRRACCWFCRAHSTVSRASDPGRVIVPRAAQAAYSHVIPGGLRACHELQACRARCCPWVYRRTRITSAAGARRRVQLFQECTVVTQAT